MNLKRYITNSLSAFLLATVLFSCTDEGSKIGIIYDNEHIDADYIEYNVLTQSMLLGSVRQSGRNCYLGAFIDPETGGKVEAAFATQFHIFEDMRFPDRNSLFPSDGQDHSLDPVGCDSIEVRLYIKSTTGDINNPLTIEVYPLSRDKVIREGAVYNSDVNIMSQFVENGQQPIATKTVAGIDYNVSDSILNSQSYTKNIRIVLPREYGNNFVKTYYDNPDSYHNSYNFIRQVCAGLYFRVKNGSGTIHTIDIATLNLYLTTYEDDKAQPQSIRFSATPEVLQCTQIENNNLESIIDSTEMRYTYVKTPAGICTEVTLPIEEIIKGHEADSISKAAITFPRYGAEESQTSSLGIPKVLLMVPKKEMKAFFNEHRVADAKTTFIANYNTSYNSYTFTNISNIISHCRPDSVGDTDWNKVLLIPVTTSSTTDTYGNSSLTSVSHDMGFNSASLVRGTTNYPLKLQIVYSKFY